MGKLFVDFRLKPDFDCFKDAAFWCKMVMEAVGTGLWILLATKAGGEWGWGLSYAVISLSFPGHSFNTLTNWGSLIRGDCDWLNFVMNFVFHFLGAICAQNLAPFIGLEADGDASHSLCFVGANCAFSAEFYNFFFSSEFVGLFLYTIFTARSTTDMPASLWTVLLITVAFWLGGANFVFLPARLFNKFTNFASAGAWAALVCQLWAATIAAVVLEYAWTE